MPAVQLARLKNQIETLAASFDQPDVFIANLRALFEQYGDLTYRAGQGVKPASLLPTYHVPAVVIKTLDLNLAAICAAQPQHSLAIVDRLWAEKYLEPRQTACILLGHTALEPIQAILDRLETWSLHGNDGSLVNLLLDRGSQRLRREATNRWLDVLRDWMGSSDPALRRNGLAAIMPFIQDREFKNLPVVFTLITPALQQDSESLSAELQKGLTALARRSPVETGYFLRQILATSTDPSLHRLVRRCLPAFPGETQARLKAALLSKPVQPSNA